MRQPARPDLWEARARQPPGPTRQVREGEAARPSPLIRSVEQTFPRAGVLAEVAMDFEERRYLEEHFRSLDDAALRHLAALERSQYRAEALEMPLGELAKRRLPALSPREYWQQFPDDWIARVRFCYECWATTTDQSPGATLTVYLIGTRLLGKDDPCP